jgi:hypothetical protein
MLSKRGMLFKRNIPKISTLLVLKLWVGGAFGGRVQHTKYQNGVLLFEHETFQQNLKRLTWGTHNLFSEHESLKKQET